MKSELIKVAEIVATCAAGVATYYYGLRPLFRKIRSYLDFKDVEKQHRKASRFPMKENQADEILANWVKNPNQRRPK